MEHSPQRKSSQNAVLYLGQEHKLHDSDKGDSEVELDFEFDERDIRYSPLLIQQVYIYWYRQGLFGIFLSDILRLMTLSFTMALCFFVVLCIDRTVLFSTYSLVDSVFSSHLTLSKIEAFLTPQIKHPEPKSFGEYFFVLVFTITLLVWPTNYQTRTFFHKLMGSSRVVTDVTWNEVVAAIKKEYGGVHDELDIVNSIMLTDNYLLALINEKQLNFKVPVLSCFFNLELLTMALEKGLRICLSPLLEKIKRMEDLNVFEDKSTLRRNLILYGIIGLLISPLTAVLVMVFVLLEYGEQFKNSPGQLLGNDIYCLRAQFSHLLGVQDWSLLARYKFRDYNELQHLFEARMKKTYKPATEFFDNRTSNYFVIFARFISFQLSSVIFFLLVASFYDAQFLTNTKLLGNLNALMVIGGLGTALAGLRKIVPSERTVYEPKKAILELSAMTHYYPKRWIGQEHTDSTYQDLKRLYPYSLITFFWEMLGIFIAPLQMLTMSRNADAIVEYLRDNTIQLNRSALYSKHGCFKKTKVPNGTGDSIHDYPYKVVQSMINFKLEYPEWVPPTQLEPFFNQSNQIHNSTLRESFQDYKSETTKDSTTSGLTRSSIAKHLKLSEKQKESFSKSLFGYRADENISRDEI